MSSPENMPVASVEAREPKNPQERKLVFEIGDTAVPVDAFSRGNSEMKVGAAARELFHANDLKQAEVLSAAIREGENRFPEGIPAETLHAVVGDSPYEQSTAAVLEATVPEVAVGQEVSDRESEPGMEKAYEQALDGLGAIKLWEGAPSVTETEQASIFARAREAMAAARELIKEFLKPREMESDNSETELALDLKPATRNSLAAWSLVSVLGGIGGTMLPVKDAEASFLGGVFDATMSRIDPGYAAARRQEEAKKKQAERQAASAVEQAQKQSERLKERYAQESQRVVDQYDRDDSAAERNYDNQQRQLLSGSGSTRNQDEGLKKKMADRIDVSYHKEKLKAAEKAWNGMSRVKEKYVQISTTGVAYQSQVNERFLENLQRVATKAAKDLQKLGTEAVTIIPLIGSMDSASTEASPAWGNTEEMSPQAGAKIENGSQPESNTSGVDYSLLSR